MPSVLFSIIIPVYNVAPYIEQCICSVLKQDADCWEMILVDDGSTDGSSVICDIYAHRYATTIKVLHKTNGGLSDARNAGLREAHGQYIVFLDSDDYWDGACFLKEMRDIVLLRNPDIIVFGHKKVSEKGILSTHVPLGDAKDIYQLVLQGSFNICAWDKAIRKCLLTDNSIDFRVGVFSEDMEWCAKVYRVAETCAVLQEMPYAYRQREGSITKKISIYNVSDIMNNYNLCLDIKNTLVAEKKDLFNYYLAKNLSMFIIVLSYMKHSVRKDYEGFIQKNLSTLLFATRRREKILYYTIKFLGISNAERCIAISRKIRHGGI